MLAVLSIVFHLTKGVDYEEASLSFVLLVLLVEGRRHFTVRSREPEVALAAVRLGTTLLVGYGPRNPTVRRSRIVVAGSF